MEPYGSYDEEVAAVQQFLSGITGTPNDRKKYIKDNFDVLERLRVLYKNDGFRSMMLSKLDEFQTEYTNSQNADVLARMQALKATLQAYDTKPSILNRRGLGVGSYGCIVKPALPNRGNNLKWTSYPSNVTKLFSDEDEYRKAISHSKSAYNILGKQENHRVDEYTFQNWDFSNLGRKAKGRCGKSSGPIYPLRMPDLGKSFYHVVNDPTSLASIRTLDPSVILNECVRMIEDVYKIYTAGYIHGDIRETNIMIDPRTGHMALIDFDWFYPIEEFKKKYKN
jgi:serine/threonine protein kinase